MNEVNRNNSFSKMGQTQVTLRLMFFFFFFFFFLNLLCSITMSSAQDLNMSIDESSLLHIKSFITLDPNNILSTNWSQGTTFCTWIGVTCSARPRQRVISLNLFDYDLTGTISPQIGNLSFLTYLDLGNNTFTGQIPDSIGNLFRLRELRMAFNMLSGNVPASLELLGNLEILDLSDNSLRGNVPWGIFNISSIREILLAKNGQLSGDLPPDICPPSTRLQRLRLSINQFSGEIPRGLHRCVELRFVYLAWNNFTGNLPEHIGNLKQLQLLAFGRNQLTGTIPPSIGNLSNLVILDLKENNLEGTVPSEMGHLSSLTFLSLGINNLNGELPYSIFNLTRLQTIDLTMNQLTGRFPPSIDVMLPNIRIMYFGGNNFFGQIPNTFSNLSHLTIFEIAFNSFIGNIPINLGNLRDLQVLRLGKNQFTNNLSIPDQEFLTPLVNCRNLTYIDFSFNSITGVLPVSIGNLTSSLTYFRAGYCRIEGTIPPEIGNLNNLLLLQISGNNLIGEIPSTLGNLINLQIMLLDSNNLHGSLPESLCSLENLFTANLSVNTLSGQLPTCLGNLSSLRELFLNNNSFNTTIPRALWQNTHLQVLNLSRNFFYGSLPDEIGNLDTLQELYLFENQLSGNIPFTIGELQSLTNLQLQNNRFDGSMPSSLSNLIDLRYLDLSQNNISGSIPMSLENLRHIDYFNVSYNELQGEIPVGGRFGNFTPAYFIGNRGLCGAAQFGVEACRTNTSKSSRHRNKLLIYILPPLGSIILLLVILLLVRYYGRNSTISSSHSEHLENTHERISYYEILRGTSNLDVGNLIGKGSIGLVFKGTFSNGMVAAVKVFNLEVQGAFKSFDSECEIMGNLRHRNLVKIITSCSNPDFKALVIEYMPNGNLDKWFYSPDCAFSIGHRLQIIVDVASALEYLHHGYDFPIVHCDLKPNNILLDEQMVAHVADFGISKLMMEDQRMEQTKTFGTIGYMAPEYGSSGLVSTMADVYSYGILLMETFTRKKPTHELFSGELTMHSWVSEAYHSNLMQIIDVELLNTDDELIKSSVMECVRSILELAIQCAAHLPEERPNMKEVSARLQKISFKLNETRSVKLFELPPSPCSGFLPKNHVELNVTSAKAKVI